MRILVLDTIHGGAVLAEALLRCGHDVDAVDVYRGKTMPVEDAEERCYDLVTAPVHLNPDHPLLHIGVPVITHHEMVRRLIKTKKPIIEITGTRGKTTAVFAVSKILDGKGIIHSSRGTFCSESDVPLFKKSITPASLIFAQDAAQTYGADWIAAEESAGVAGCGVLGILTSTEDYRIADGKKSALEAKLKSLERCRKVLVPKGIPLKENWYCTDDLVQVEKTKLTCSAGSFENKLLAVPAYCSALKIAAASAVILGKDASVLKDFQAVEGRMKLSSADNIIVLDNSNSGTNKQVTMDAADYLKTITDKPIILAIGIEHKTVCEGFSQEDINSAAEYVNPLITIHENSYDAAKQKAVSAAKENNACVLLAVKTWR